MTDCVLGTENRTRVDGVERAVQEIKEAVTNLSNHYSERPTSTMLKAIAIMTGLLGTSIGVNITLICFIVKMA